MDTLNFLQDITISRAESTSSLSNFYCGIPVMDSFIHDRNNGLEKYVRAGLTALWIVSMNNRTIAFFALSKSSLDLNTFDLRKLNKDEVAIEDDIFYGKESLPAVELDYLAIRENMRGKGLGERIIASIIEKIQQDDLTATMFLKVDALHTRDYSAVGFYKKCGFVESEHYRERHPSPVTDTGVVRMYLSLIQPRLS